MYQKQIFTDHETVLTAAHLDHIEEGIRMAYGEIPGLVTWEDLQDRPFYAVSQGTELLPQTAVTLGVEDGAYAGIAAVPEEIAQLWETDWSWAAVTWDGRTYHCSPFFVNGWKGVGNYGRATGAESSGEPFGLVLVPAGVLEAGPSFLLADLETFPQEGDTESTVTHDLAVTLYTDTEVKKLDMKYLPLPAPAEDNKVLTAFGGRYILTDLPQGADGLPAVTLADEGKFLRVAGGVWKAAAVDSAEEVSV